MWRLRSLFYLVLKIGVVIGLLAAVIYVLALFNVTIDLAPFLKTRLSKIVGAPASVERLSVSFDGTIIIQNLVINHPNTTCQEPWLRISKCCLKAKPASLLQSGIRVTEATFEDCSISAIRRADGTLDTDIAPPTIPKPTPASSNAATNAPAPTAKPTFDITKIAVASPEPEDHYATFKPIMIEKIKITNASFAFLDYADRAAATYPNTLRITNVTVAASNLAIAPHLYFDAPHPCTVDCSALVQQGTNAPSDLRIEGRTGPVGDYIPQFYASVVLTNLDILSFSTLLPDIMQRTLGGTTIVCSGHAGYSEESLIGDACITTQDGNSIASIDDWEIDLDDGHANLTELVIAQPPGYVDGDFLYLPKTHLCYPPDQPDNAPLTFTEITIDNPELSVIKNSNFVHNTEVFLNKSVSWGKVGSLDWTSNQPPDYSDTNITDVAETTNVDANLSSTPTTNTAPAKPREPIDPVIIHSLRINGLTATYTDLSFTNPPLRVKMCDGCLITTNLVIGDLPTKKNLTNPAILAFTGRIVQAPHPDAYVGLYSKLILPNGNRLLMNAAFRVVGLELDTIGPVVPVGTAQTIGGDALDLHADFSTSQNYLSCVVKAIPVGGSELSFEIGGTPDNPEIVNSSILYNIFQRTRGGIGNQFRNMAHAGRNIYSAAAKSARAVGRGVSAAASSVGSGIANTGEGLYQGNLTKVEHGIYEGLIGPARHLADAVTGVGSAVVTGAVKAGQSYLGVAATAIWWQDLKTRWAKVWNAAIERVDREPFPPKKVIANDSDMTQLF